MRWLGLDISNLLHRTFFVDRGTNDESELAGLACHMALTSMHKFYKKHKPDRVVMFFDRSSWRKKYTASELCVSGRLYKGNRRKDMSPAQIAKFQKFMELVKEFEELITCHTTIVTLQADLLEADDLMAGFVQQLPADDSIVLITADSDMWQLLKYKNVQIYTPNDKLITLEEYDHDPEYYLFQKCVRGDMTDNIQSAFPRVRATRIKQAYSDEYARVQLMQETWTDHENRKFTVQDLYEENRMLIDLSAQPAFIRDKITQTIKEELNAEKRFSMMHLLRYLKKYELTKISQNVDTYLSLLSK